ncbi:N-formylglutamate amidohydrolase [Aliiglaciecola sp. LCG003]|uniref:N-formylglutamate amidohydrolase n=1 Tax=Aliiglaciecola sp. LCG003 TaxID=3053655 RepID=UPI002572BBEC|nr:N-formylglutamate amidohydrolase [Aliiglaciecola sp. LCG003]WJG09181.1 N-formylglutamate amidohydrolase [Aliiglaciecola sp. LCG003]
MNQSNFLPLWSVHRGSGPVLATAVHAGHEIRAELESILALEEADRLREEDPYTDVFTKVVENRIIPIRSRFEVDLNRPRDEAVYVSPENAWGLQVWEHPPDKKMIERSLREFDLFYAKTKSLLTQLETEYGQFVVFDIHSYNYRRNGPNEAPADPIDNPDINIGTGSMDHDRWADLVAHFIRDLRAFDYLGGHLDVRENIKFRGRQFALWVHTHFPKSGCVLSIELKKIFIDEWTGRVDIKILHLLVDALKSTLPGIAEELQRL